MELKNEKLNSQNIDNIHSKFSKIKNTMMNLKKVNKYILSFYLQNNEFLFLSLNNKSLEKLKKRNLVNFSQNYTFNPGKSYTEKQEKPIEILNNNTYYKSGQNSRNKNIIISKTEIELMKNFPNDIKGINSAKNDKLKVNKLNEHFKKINLRNGNNLGIFELNSARSFKLNYTDLNKYMNKVQNLNSGKITEKKIKRISLNKYFNLKNKDDNKSISSYSVKTLYNKNKTKYNSYITKRNIGTFDNQINSIYHETGNIINNNINNSINKIKREKELLKLKKILRELKSKNKIIKKELYSLKGKNLDIEKKKINKNKKVFMTVKKIFNGNIMNNKFLNQNIDNKYINMINSKLYTSSSYNEKVKFIRNIYLEEKLKNSLINKTHLLYVKSHDKNKSINGAEIQKDNDIDLNNINNIWNWIISIIEKIENITKYNNKIKNHINKFTQEKNIYKKYYSNWMNLLQIKDKEELIKKIDALINVKNINANEEAKMFKILLNKKH